MAPVQAGYAPTLETFLKSLKGQPLESSIERLVYLLKRRQIKGAEQCATATARILLQVVAKSRWNDVDQLLVNVQQHGATLTRAAPRELVISNIVRRVLGLIRDEAIEDRNAAGDEYGVDSVSDMGALATPPEQPTSRPGPTPIKPGLATHQSFISKSMFNLLSAVHPADSTGTGTPVTGASTPVMQATSSATALRSEVIDGIEEIVDELSQADDQIAGFAEVQIHPGDYILAYQPSPTVEKFLVRAASKRHFTLLIASGPPQRGAPEATYAPLKKKLNAAGVKTIHIMAGSFAAYMPRVSKVVMGASAVLANGAIVTDGGSAVVARAAHEFSKPVIVLSGVYKLCPENSSEVEDPVELGDSSGYVSFADGPLVNGVEVENTVSELVPPELIDMYITNLGPHTRDHLDDILADHYKVEDIDFPLQ
ncbi:nagb/rpia/CoA transferase-like protein [Coniochaeta ligniaria NRRL 30616]|uniref:Translation initiation factor eIF2B subunit beta n=1 Tax=Coniochaeta ligniaria NRRL 30616 TaxID=1408157 RepID=A0A1J7I7X4_9PEZI|nr:nagb/rpia/CoA transferase-like protein [Coniochaeta ligniaria NRRL 30616]